MSAKKKESKTESQSSAPKSQSPLKLAREALDTANASAAYARKIVTRLEQLFGFDIDGDGRVGKGGFVRLGLLLCIASLCLVGILVFAESLDIPFLTESVYGTAKVTGDSSTKQGGFRADNLYAENSLTVISNAILPSGSIGVSEAATALKTKVACVNIGGMSGTDQKYVFVAPEDCAIVSVGIVSDTSTSGSGGGTNWTFQVVNLTLTSNLLSSAKVTDAATTNELAADALYDLGADQALFVNEGDVLELQATTNAVPTSLTSSEIMAVVEYY